MLYFKMTRSAPWGATEAQRGGSGGDFSLALEERRCQSFGLPFSQMDIDSAIRASNKSLKDSDLATLKTFYFAIGSPMSLVALQEILKRQRTAVADKGCGGGTDLSLADRVRAIERIGSDIAYLVLCRRCHIY
jgi:hypothetical protein